jgi:hypothetical protein
LSHLAARRADSLRRKVFASLPRRPSVETTNMYVLYYVFYR